MQPANIVNRALSNVLDDLYTYLKDQASTKIKKADIQRKLPLLSNYIDSVRLVKTLWQIDKPVDVESFYCDSHVLLRKPGDKNQYRKKVDFVSDLDSEDNFVIQGIAGQGKSILLRHLFINEATLGNDIPIFIELRRIQKNETLVTHILRFLQILDLPDDHRLFQILLKSGKFMFFLDGFDEIPKDQMPSILNQLEYLTSVSRSCQFIVTSRLDSPIVMSTLFNVVSLDNLRHDEYQQLVKKLSNKKEYADAITARIEAQQPHMSELLCTPLLVTLLLISCKFYQTIPVQLSDFYDSIFLNLLQRHDGTKPTFTRARGCSLNDTQYRQVFDAFCFQSKKYETILFDYQQVYSSVQKAMSLLGIKEDIDAYIKDIKNITCLLLEEAGQYRFIHRTVQDYYSASFLKNLPEPSAIKFYQTCLDESTIMPWHQELHFLADIDKYRHIKYYLIPLCSRYMGYEHPLDPNFLLPAEMSLERTKVILNYWDIGFVHNGAPHRTFIGFGRTLSFIANDYSFIKPILNLPYTKVLPDILKDITPLHSLRDEREFIISVRQMLDKGFFNKEFQSVAQTMATYAHARWQEAVSYLKKREAFIETFELI